MKKITVSILVILFFSVIFFAQRIHAGSFSNAKVTIADSRAGQTGVEYDFSFTASVSTAIKQLTVQFCTAASGTCTTPTGMTTTGTTRSSDNLTGTGRSDNFGSNGTLTTTVTSISAQSPLTITANFTGITNPTTADTTFYALITTYSDTGSTVIDTATVSFAILTSSSITVTASVGTSYSFTITAVTTGTVNGATINMPDTTSSSIPFGLLSVGSSKIASHDLTVTSNSTNGYTVTVKASTDPPLQDGSNDIDKFTGANNAPITWSAPNGTTSNINTGFFGYTTNNANLSTGTADRFTSSAGNKWAGPDTTAAEIAHNAGPVTSGETTRVGWQVQVDASEPPGSYAGTVILVATPTY